MKKLILIAGLAFAAGVINHLNAQQSLETQIATIQTRANLQIAVVQCRSAIFATITPNQYYPQGAYGVKTNVVAKIPALVSSLTDNMVTVATNATPSVQTAQLSASINLWAFNQSYGTNVLVTMTNAINHLNAATAIANAN